MIGVKIEATNKPEMAIEFHIRARSELKLSGVVPEEGQSVSVTRVSL